MDIRKIIQEALEEVGAESSPYVEALKNPHPEIVALIKKYQDLSEEEQAKKPLLWWILDMSTQHYKMSKEDSKYTSESEKEGQTCGNCPFMYTQVATGKSICSKIQGDITAEAWCKFWVPVEK